MKKLQKLQNEDSKLRISRVFATLNTVKDISDLL